MHLPPGRIVRRPNGETWGSTWGSNNNDRWPAKRPPHSPGQYPAGRLFIFPPKPNFEDQTNPVRNMDATTAFGDSSSTVSLKRSSISDTVDFASPPLPAPLAPPNIPIEDLNGELEDDDDDDDDRDTNDGAQDGARKKPRLSSSTTTAQASRPMCTNCEQCESCVTVHLAEHR